MGKALNRKVLCGNNNSLHIHFLKKFFFVKNAGEH